MKRARPGRVLGRGAATLGRLLLLVFWSGAVSLTLSLPPWLGVLLVLGLVLAFLYLYAWRPVRLGQRRKLATLHLRPLPPEAWRWLWLAVPAMLLFNAGFLAVYLPFAGEPPEDPRWLQELMERPAGWLLAGSLILVSAPVMEEFVFRGWILHYWKPLLGPAASLLLSAFLFGCIHLSLFTLPFHTCVGLFLGAAVYATRSLWAGVFLHAMHNATAALLAPLFMLDESLRPASQFVGLLALIGGAAAFWRICTRLRAEASRRRGATSAARRLPA